MKKLWMFMLALSLSAATLSAQSVADPIVMSAGGVTIRQSEFERALATLPADYQEYARGAGKRQFAEDYLRMRLLADAGMKAGLATDPGVVRELEMMRNNIIANAHLKTIEKSLAASAPAETLNAKHILIAFASSDAAQPGKPPLTEAQARAKAEMLHVRITGGADFGEIAKKESDDVGSAAGGGDLGEFVQGRLIEEFERAILAATPGRMSPVTRTRYGYHIILVEKRAATGPARALSKEELQTLLSAELAKLVANAKPVYSDAYFGVKKD